MRGPKRPKRPWVHLEPLESRHLLTSITEYPALISGQNGAPTQIAFGSDGNLWFSEPTGPDIGILSPASHNVTQAEVRLADADPLGIVASTESGGPIWFSLNGVTEFQLGEDTPPATTPQVIGRSGYPEANAAGITLLGNVPWFTMPSANSIGTYNPGSSEFSVYSLSSTANINVSGFNSMIVAGPDGNLWFTEPGAIGIFSPTSQSVIGQVVLPSSSGTQWPSAITVGPDNNIWFTEYVPSPTGTGSVSAAVGVISAATQTLITETSLPGSAQPQGITAGGPDNFIWFTESGLGAIGVINPATGAVTQTISIPTNVVSNPDPVGITTGPGGSIWFADKSGAIGTVNVTTQLVVTPPPPDVSADAPFTITVSDEYTPGGLDASFNGPVALALSSNPGSSTLGGTTTVNAVNGVATFSGLTLNNAGNGYALQATASGTSASTSSSAFDVVNGPATQLIATTQPPGTIGTGFAFNVVVQDEYVVNNQVDTSFNSPVTIALSGPSGASGLGGTTTVNAVNGMATFSDLTLNNPGSDYMLQVTSSGASPETIGPINVVTQITPSITNETITYTYRRYNKRTGRPIGKPIALLITFNFNEPMDAGSTGDAANYQVDSLVSKKVKIGKGKFQKELVPQPVGFSATYNATSDSAVLTLSPKQTFPKGGEVTVEGLSIESAQGVSGANETFTISPKGRGISGPS
jgi:streptogramin lyase